MICIFQFRPCCCFIQAYTVINKPQLISLSQTFLNCSISLKYEHYENHIVLSQKVKIMHNKIKVLFHLFALTLFACGGTVKEATETVQYQLKELESKVFNLDNETAFDQITPQYSVINGIGFYHFFNRKNSSIYFYNYQSGEITHKVKLSSEGPDEVLYPYGFFEYWVSDFDNIFINTMQHYYRINKNGKVLKRIVALENFSWDKPLLSLDQSTTFEDGRLYAARKVIVNPEDETSWLRAAYDWDKGEFETTYLNEKMIVTDYEEKAERIREMSKTGGVTSLSFHYAGDHKNLYVSSVINDSLYYFQNDQFVEAYFAGVPEIKSTDLDGYFTLSIVKEFKGGVSIGPNPTQPAHFTRILQSTDKRYIYRLLVHGAQPSIDPESDQEVPKVFGASMVVFDTQTNTSGNITLPEDIAENLLYASDMFVNEEGIHFPVKEVESENEKAYRVFKVDALVSN